MGTVDTPLYPFKLPNGNDATTKDGFNIETQLNYTYGEGSLEVGTDTYAQLASLPECAADIEITNFPKPPASFVIYVMEELDDGKRQCIGVSGFFGRRNAKICRNCQKSSILSLDIDLTP